MYGSSIAGMEIDYRNKLVLAPMVRVVSAFFHFFGATAFFVFFFGLCCIIKDNLAAFELLIFIMNCGHVFFFDVSAFHLILGYVAVQDAGCWIWCRHHIWGGDYWSQAPQMRAANQWFLLVCVCLHIFLYVYANVCVCFSLLSREFHFVVRFQAINSALWLANKVKLFHLDTYVELTYCHVFVRCTWDYWCCGERNRERCFQNMPWRKKSGGVPDGNFRCRESSSCCPNCVSYFPYLCFYSLSNYMSEREFGCPFFEWSRIDS